MLSTNDIGKLLESIGWSKKKERIHVISYTLPGINQYVYVNKDAGGNYSGLIIHPRYQSHREDLLKIQGVKSQKKYNFKANMGKFPKKQNRGKSEIPYGIPFGFDTEEAFQYFINKLLSLPKAYSRNELEDIEEANEDLLCLSPTEREAVINSRIGQGKFRKKLIKFWCSCSITNCSEVSLLKASHIKPWRDSNNLIIKKDLMFSMGYYLHQIWTLPSILD